MKSFFTFTALLLGIAAVYFESFYKGAGSAAVSIIPVLLIILLSVSDFLISLFSAKYKRIYLSHNIIPSVLLFIFILLSAADFILIRYSLGNIFTNLSVIIVFRNTLILLKVFSRFQKFSTFIQTMAVNPAHTIVISFLAVITAGTIFLAMPFASSDGIGLSFVDSLFTATSAVCVTGLIVVDTALHFSFWGRLIILLLIQIGGLGIMILSFSTVFMFKKSVSLENKMLISYMINEDDMTKISSMVKNIVALTLMIEGAGAALLFVFMELEQGISPWQRVFYSFFHSVSAFCNAGFALFSDSLEQFSSNPAVVLIFASLIILGGISFSVMTDIGAGFYRKILSLITGKYRKSVISTNSRIVLTYTIFLITAGMFVIYFFEHGNIIKNQTMPMQYLSAFFQSVTLRTAGFNTIAFSSLMPATTFIMILFMFTGGASGSTAGGIKINTLAVINAYFRSTWKKERCIILYNREIGSDTVLKAFSVLSLGLAAVLAGFFILLATEKAAPFDLLFETVSAFATVGLSTGVTSSLSAAGKIVIIILMFTGRLGPLTIVASIGAERMMKPLHRYPGADISIG